MILYLHGNAETISQHHRRELYKVRQQLVDRVLLTLFLPPRELDKTGFVPPSQARKVPVVEFSLLSQQNPVHELLPHLVQDLPEERLPRARRRLQRVRREQRGLPHLRNHPRLRRPGWSPKF